MNNYSPKEMESRIRQIAEQISKEFNLNLRKIEFIRDENLYGFCRPWSGEIHIKLQWPDGELVPVMEVWRTVAHELAHFAAPHHNQSFWELNKTIINRISQLLGFRVRPEVAVFREGYNYTIIK